MGNERDGLNIVVAYYNYSDLKAVEGYLRDTNVRVVSAVQDGQRLFDEAVRLEVDVALVCPQVTGYRSKLIESLLFEVERPIPVVGLVEATGDDGRSMVADGAKGYVTLPMGAAEGNKLVQLLYRAAEEVQRDAQAGKRMSRPVAAPSQQAWERKTITGWVPKGGGSTRTTLAVNLAVALSHGRLGNQPTCLLDFDMAKGDVHTMLGYTASLETAEREGWPLLERGLFDLVMAAADGWGRKGEGAISQVFLRNFLVPWRQDESQLVFMPGLYWPHQADEAVFRQRQMVYTMGRRIIELLHQMFAFVVVDVGQDFTQPLHRAALEAANEVLMTVPPTRTAVVDAANAMRPLRNHFGDLGKFKLVITRYSDEFGLSEKEIIEAVGLTKLATIPHDAVTAEQSINRAEPFVLTDGGPLGGSVREIAAAYLPYLVDQKKRKSWLAGIKQALTREQ